MRAGKSTNSSQGVNRQSIATTKALISLPEDEIRYSKKQKQEKKKYDSLVISLQYSILENARVSNLLFYKC